MLGRESWHRPARHVCAWCCAVGSANRRRARRRQQCARTAHAQHDCTCSAGLTRPCGALDDALTRAEAAGVTLTPRTQLGMRGGQQQPWRRHAPAHRLRIVRSHSRTRAGCCLTQRSCARPAGANAPRCTDCSSGCLHCLRPEAVVTSSCWCECASRPCMCCRRCTQTHTVRRRVAHAATRAAAATRLALRLPRF